MYQVLLVEDSKEIYQMVGQTVLNIAQVHWSQTVADARMAIKNHAWDLILLDIELPDGNGIELCSELQASHPQTPIFMLTSHSELSEKVLGFSAGADDYITKPFLPLELRARLEARLRKSKLRESLADIYKWNELQICKSRQEVHINQNGEFQKIELTSLEFKILIYFAQKPGQVIQRDQMLNDIWGEDIHVYQRSVDTHVSKLRKKLAHVSHIVESVHGAGYKFNPTNG